MDVVSFTLYSPTTACTLSIPEGSLYNNHDNHNNRNSSSSNNNSHNSHSSSSSSSSSSNSSNNTNQQQQQPVPVSLLGGVWKIVRASLPVVVVAWMMPFVLYLMWETEAAITNSMVDTFAVGVDGWVPSDETATVVRAALMGDLLPILQPDHSQQYFVILGEKGVGKSTAVRQTIKQLEDPRGVIYIMAPSADSSAFVARLAETTKYRKAVDFWGRLRRHIADDRVSVSEVSVGLWPRLEKKLLEVGKAYLAKYKRPPVLVIDAADKIYKKDPDLLFDIQALAKDGADSSCLRVVFVISETSAFEMIQSHSHASRSEVFVVGEIEDNEAVEYLVSKGINKKNATDAVARITGGRFTLLNSYVSAHQRSITNDQVLANYHAATERALKKLRIKKTDPLFSNVAAGSLYEKDDQVDVDELSKLARENILVVDLATGLVTFNSRHVQTFFTEAGVFLSLVCCRPLLARMKQLCLFAHEHAHCHVRKRSSVNSQYADSLLCFLGGDDA